MTVRLHIGCCGRPQPQAEYFRNFSTIEAQQTFYQPPNPETENLRAFFARAP